MQKDNNNDSPLIRWTRQYLIKKIKLYDLVGSVGYDTGSGRYYNVPSSFCISKRGEKPKHDKYVLYNDRDNKTRYFPTQKAAKEFATKMILLERISKKDRKK